MQLKSVRLEHGTVSLISSVNTNPLPAITTLYPWKVKEFAEEEAKQNAGSSKKGTFAILNEDITRYSLPNCYICAG
jgi:hypothetical protein